MPKGKNHSSKRTTLHQKYKIQKKVREHRRKIRKDEKTKAKKGGGKLAARIRKDPGIPNLWPFKEQLLREVEEHKEQVVQDKIAAKVEMQKAKEKARLAGMSSAQQLAALKNSAQNRTSTFEMQEVRNHPRQQTDVAHAAFHNILRKFRASRREDKTSIDTLPMMCRWIPRNKRSCRMWSTPAGLITASSTRSWRAPTSSVSAEFRQQRCIDLRLRE